MGPLAKRPWQGRCRPWWGDPAQVRGCLPVRIGLSAMQFGDTCTTLRLTCTSLVKDLTIEAGLWTPDTLRKRGDAPSPVVPFVSSQARMLEHTILSCCPVIPVRSAWPNVNVCAVARIACRRARQCPRRANLCLSPASPPTLAQSTKRGMCVVATTSLESCPTCHAACTFRYYGGLQTTLHASRVSTVLPTQLYVKTASPRTRLEFTPSHAREDILMTYRESLIGGRKSST